MHSKIDLRRAKNNASEHPGVCKRVDKKGRVKWLAYIYSSGTKIHLGIFKNFKDALNARKDGERKYWEW